jgi:hypothetical protein
MPAWRIDLPHSLRSLRAGASAAIVLLGAAGALPASAATRIEGQVLAGGAPVAGSAVTLFAASADAEGRFAITSEHEAGPERTLYLVARGGTPAANRAGGANPALGWLAALGSTPPARVTLNEFTTIASAWTHAQFLDGEGLRGTPLGLRIAAGNVPSLSTSPAVTGARRSRTR